MHPTQDAAAEGTLIALERTFHVKQKLLAHLESLRSEDELASFLATLLAVQAIVRFRLGGERSTYDAAVDAATSSLPGEVTDASQVRPSKR